MEGWRLFYFQNTEATVDAVSRELLCRSILKRA
jgi:hypothetical protein